tara:strand:+ start:834 stop:1619 length:786 start_codon:yes stop_codon:yes gene_type:complete
MKSKTRIQLFDKEGKPLSDRLVDQYTEFNTGPKEAYDGQIRIEFNLQNQDEVSGAITYLEQLVGKSPLKELSKRGRKPNSGYVNNTTAMEDARVKILEELKSKSTDQEKMIEFLRNDCNFALLTEEHMEEMGINLNLKKIHKAKGYMFYMRLLKLAKDPRNDKFDPMLAIGVKILEPSDKVLIYKDREFNTKLKIPIPPKKFIFKRQAILKFPKFMSEEERLKFRKENRELLANPDKTKSKFYNRWEPDCQIPKELLATNN